jgi:hypothetical protein
VALLSDVATALKSAPSYQKNGPARFEFSVRQRIAEGQSFSAARDFVVARPEVRDELEEARVAGFMVGGSPFGPAEAAALTGP